MDMVCDSCRRDGYDVFRHEDEVEVMLSGVDLSASGYIQDGTCSFRKNIHFCGISRGHGHDRSTRLMCVRRKRGA